MRFNALKHHVIAIIFIINQNIIMQENLNKKITIAILDGEKMILPKYAKWGKYGLFTTQGFVSPDYYDLQSVEIESVDYDVLFLVDEKEADAIFEKLPYPIYH